MYTVWATREASEFHDRVALLLDSKDDDRLRARSPVGTTGISIIPQRRQLLWILFFKATPFI